MHYNTGLRLVMSIITCALALGAGGAYGQGTRSVINATTVTTYPPMEYREPSSNKLVGFDIDVVNAMGAKMGATVNWSEASYDQLLSSITSKRVDVIVAGMGDTQERRASVSFVDYLHDNAVFFTLRSNSERYPNMESLCGKKVAVTRSTYWPTAIAKWSDEHCTKAGKPAIVVVGTSNAPDSRLQLKQSRADAAVQSAATLVYQNSIEENRYAVIGKPFYTQLSGIGFSKDDPQVGQALKKALAAIIADGTYQKLLQKWNLPADCAIAQPMINGQL